MRVHVRVYVCVCVCMRAPLNFPRVARIDYTQIGVYTFFAMIKIWNICSFVLKCLEDNPPGKNP